MATMWEKSPILPSVYAQYDNGANVFANYQNFEGKAIPSGWTTSNSGFSNTITINNGFTFNTVSGSGPAISSLSSNWAVFGNDIEEYIVSEHLISGCGSFCAVNAIESSSSSSSYAPTGNFVGWHTTGSSLPTNTQVLTLGASVVGNAIGVNIILSNVISVQNSKIYAGGVWNYTIEANTTHGVNVLTGSYLAMAISTGGTSEKSGWVGNWIRTRIPPPNNIMPR